MIIYYARNEFVQYVFVLLICLFNKFIADGKFHCCNAFDHSEFRNILDK